MDASKSLCAGTKEATELLRATMETLRGEVRWISI